jgi:hypothetical protein
MTKKPISTENEMKKIPSSASHDPQTPGASPQTALDLLRQRLRTLLSALLVDIFICKR